MTEATELTCDDWALDRTGEQYGLASSISRVAGWALSREPFPAVSMAGGASRGLSDRVRRILHGRPPEREPRWVAPALVALLVVPLYWLPAVPTRAADNVSVVVEKRAIFVADSTDLPGIALEGDLRRLVLTSLDPG